MKQNNCAIYIRKSTEKGLEQEFNSLNNQEEACKAYILSQAFNGWEHFKTYEDGGISGGTMNRPGLQKLLKDMQKGIIQTVIVYKVDRLSRSILDFYKMMQEFEKYDSNFVSITQSFDTSNSMGKLTLNMLLSFAQFEREVSSERIRDKMRASKAKGYWVGGVYPLGYDIEDKKLIINKDEAELVKLIYEKYLKYKTLAEVAKWLNSNGYKTKKYRVRGGIDFDTDIIHKILKNVVYIGKIAHKRIGKIYDGQHEAIISKELFDEVQNELKKRFNSREERKVYTRNSYILKDNFFSSNGQQFKFSNSKNHNMRFNYYYTKGCCLPAEQIDEQITNALAFLQLSKEKIENLVSKVIYSATDDFCELEININIDDKIGKLKLPQNASLSIDKKTLILKTKFIINNKALTKLSIRRNKRVLSINEINEQLIQGISLGWFYKTRWKQGESIKDIAKSEYSGTRKVQKYMSLTMLSPRIIEDIMNYKNPNNSILTKLIEIAEGIENFQEQEKVYKLK